MGICALLALVVLTSLLPVDAEAGLPAASRLALGAGDLEIRWAGLLIFFAVSAALIFWSARPSTVLARREPDSPFEPRE